jgi:hypothetical protein
MVAQVRGTPCVPTRAAAERIAWIALSSPAAFAGLATEAASLIEHERPFGVVLQVEDIVLDRYREVFPQVRDLPGGRAGFGAWCRGVAYVFGESASSTDAYIHLQHAPRIWGARVRIAISRDDAAVWLCAQFVRYGSSWK